MEPEIGCGPLDQRGAAAGWLGVLHRGAPPRLLAGKSALVNRLAAARGARDLRAALGDGTRPGRRPTWSRTSSPAHLALIRGTAGAVPRLAPPEPGSDAATVTHQGQ